MNSTWDLKVNSFDWKNKILPSQYL